MYLYKQLITKSMIFVPTLALFLIFISSFTAILSYLVLAAWALAGKQQAIQAIFMTWLINMLNPGLLVDEVSTASGRYIVILAAMISVFLHFQGKIKYHIFLTLLLGLFFIIHSFFVSPFPDVSILKSIVFFVIFVSLLSAWDSLNALQRMQAEAFIFGGMIIIMLLSFTLIGSEVGYLRNGSGFQGLLNHPQSFGPFISLLLAWLIGQFLGTKNIYFLYVGLIFLCMFLILASESRTAGGAIFIGILFAMAYIFLLVSGNKLILFPRLKTNFFFIPLLIISLVSILFSSTLSSHMKHYLMKESAINIVDSYSNTSLQDITSSLGGSRQRFFDEMSINIKEHPIAGIGFGIASNPSEMKIKRDPFLNLPLGAPVEKGIMPVAVLEELGIPGAILVLGWFVMLFRRASLIGLTSLFVLSTACMINLGENVFFSTGGMGMLVMLLVTWSVTKKPFVKNVEIPK